jgi:hypothetical protein
MNEALFRQRLQDAGLSRWELGDLLGIHPHHLHGHQLHRLSERPVRVIIELARHLNLHPADLVPDLLAVLGTPRLPAPALDDAVHSDDDAVIVLNALAHAALTPMSVEQLAEAAGWSLQRMDEAIAFALAHPDLGGPMALRRVPPYRFTLVPRTDLLSTGHRHELRAMARVPGGLGPEEAVVLLTALAVGHTPVYAEHRDRPGWREAESALKSAGLLSSDLDPGRVEVTDDVLYSLRYHHDDDLPARTPHAPATRDAT